MNIAKIIKMIVVVFMLSAHAGWAQIQPFSSQNLAAVKTEWHGKNWIMLLWSLDCPPCFKELATVQKLRLSHPALPVLLVNVDDLGELAEEREQVLVTFGLQGMPNLYFVEGQAARSRYTIDPQWGGELPRSYFIDKNGGLRGRSGLVSEALLTQWLIPQS